MLMYIYLLLYGASLVTGFFTSLLGVGGGTLLLPVLLLYYDHSNTQNQLLLAISTTMMLMAFSFLGSAIVHWKNLPFRLFFRVVHFLMLGVLIGVSLLYYLPEIALQIIIVLLIVMPLLRTFFKKNRDTHAPINTLWNPQSVKTYWPLSFMTAFSISGSIGGGFFIVPYMHHVKQYTIKQATLFSILCGLFITSCSAIIMHLAQPHQWVNTPIISALFFLFLGHLLGKKLHNRFSNALLNRLFSALLFFALFFYIQRILSTYV